MHVTEQIDHAPASEGGPDFLSTALWPGLHEAPSPTTRRLATISVVVPAKNEERSIGWVLERVPHWVDEVILVDGDSTDNTIETAQAQWPWLKCVKQKRAGKGAALREGFAAATGDIIVMIDADGSMDPLEIDRYIEPLVNQDYDLVKGSRRLPGGGSTDITRFRCLGNTVLLWLVNAFYGSKFSELCYGFMAFKRSCLESLALTADGFEIETQIVVNSLRAGLKVAEVPSMEFPRRYGRSNLRPIRDGMRVLATLLNSVEARPGRSPKQAERLIGEPLSSSRAA